MKQGVSACVCISLSLYISVSLSLYIYIYVCVYIYIYLYIYIYMYVYIHQSYACYTVACCKRPRGEQRAVQQQRLEFQRGGLRAASPPRFKNSRSQNGVHEPSLRKKNRPDIASLVKICSRTTAIHEHSFCPSKRSRGHP